MIAKKKITIDIVDYYNLLHYKESFFKARDFIIKLLEEEKLDLARANKLFDVEAIDNIYGKVLVIEHILNQIGENDD